MNDLDKNVVTGATYSAEDNKLRLYVSDERFSDETYQVVKEKGFNWAPKQKLFVAPAWTPSREDLCLELAGSIEPDEFTLAERAEWKRDRLDVLANKRYQDSDAFAKAADGVLASLPAGQPILVGHHSERRARKAVESADRNMDKSVEMLNRANYWLYRAEGVERHANRKNNPSVRARRIKTLLADLRTQQRKINHGYFVMELWEKVSNIAEYDKKLATAKYYASIRVKDGALTTSAVATGLNGETLSVEEAISKSTDWGRKIANNSVVLRTIAHTLNRIGYERSFFKPTKPYDGELTAVILKAFARENGADKPDCKKVGDNWELSSAVNLPMHIATGKKLSLGVEEWKTLMMNVGYSVPAAKPKSAPIVNLPYQSVEVIMYREKKTLRQISMTKAEYSAIYKDYRGTKPTSCGNYRVKICLEPNANVEFWKREWVAVLLTDSKQHDFPDSSSFTEQVEK
jgi:hypothetical protein